MRLAVIDATFIDAGQLHESEECYKKPVIYSASQVDLQVEIHPNMSEIIDGKLYKSDAYADLDSLKICKRSFDKHFQLIEGGGNHYIKTPQIAHSVKMEIGFFVRELEDNENGVKNGTAGDYLVTDKSGVNNVVDATDFSKQYLPIMPTRYELKNSGLEKRNVLDAHTFEY